MKRIVLALGGAILTLTAASCGATAHHTSAPGGVAAPVGSVAAATTTTTTVPATTTTTLPDTSVVPPVITVAYVDAVFVKLDHVLGNAVRTVQATKQVTPVVAEELGSVYTPRLETAQVQSLAELLVHGLPGLKGHPGDQLVTVSKLVSASRSCVFAKVLTNYNSVALSTSPPPASEYVGLRAVGVVDGGQFNPTPWQIFYSLDLYRLHVVPDQCNASASASVSASH